MATSSSSSSGGKKYNIRLNSDYPSKTALIQIDNTTKIADLKSAAVKALSLDDGYTFYACIFGQDVIPLDDDINTNTADDAGLRDGFTVLCRAPPSLKPVIRRKKVGGESKEEAKDDSDKYKGFTKSNAISQLLSLAGKPREKIALEFIDINIVEILKTPEFVKIPKDALIKILRSDHLSAPEADLFDAALKWGRAELKKQDKKDGPSELKTVLADILPHIRFPTMSTMEVAAKVSGSGLLDSTQVLELFTYLAARSAGGETSAKLGSSLKFSTKARVARKKPQWFKWDRSLKHSSLTLSDDGLTVTSSTSTYQPIFGDTELKSGVHEFEVSCDTLAANNFALVVGVAPASAKTRYTSSMMIGYNNHIPGWAYAPYHQRRYHNRMDRYGTRRGQTGDIIRVRVDVDKGTLEFFLNGEPCASSPAYSDVTGPVVPAMSLYGYTTITVRFPK